MDVRSIITFQLLLIIPAILYCFASFYNTIRPASTIGLAILIAVLFATVEYCFKIPIIAYGDRIGMNAFAIQISWIVLTLAISLVFTMAQKRVQSPKKM